jgi:hypothetical protein
VHARAALASGLAVIVTGSLLHFAWEWSGRSPLMAVFAATSESTWEHLKLAFCPTLALAPVQRHWYGRPPGWLVATALRVLIPPVLIVLLFHGYVAFAGRNHLLLDIGIFVVAVLAGETVGHATMWRRTGLGMRVGAGIVVAGGIVAFSVLSFRPPAFFLFEVPR